MKFEQDDLIEERGKRRMTNDPKAAEVTITREYYVQ
jgi:hypothetical protein